MTLALVLTALGVGLFIGFKLPYWYALAAYNSEKNKALKNVVPNPVDEDKLCQGPHAWIEATVNEGTRYTLINVCEKCGFIPSKNLMATQEGIKRVKEHKKRIEQELAFENEFLLSQQKEYEAFFADEIKNGLSLDKLFKVYEDGQTAYQRYVMFKLAKLESQEKVDGREEVRPH
jgi:hypothetical protein